MPTDRESKVSILDHIEKITVRGDVFLEPANEYWALICLRDGMEFLYHQARRCDQAAERQVNPTGNLRFSGLGNLPEFKHVPKTLLTCAFHWYAISACQYVRTVGAIAYRDDPTRLLPQEYAESIIPNVIAFRDKVAAHFAWSTYNKRDNDAERLMSILPALAFEDDSFYVGAWTASVRRGGKVSDSGAIQPWSLCKVHETLRMRYWPDLHTGSESNGARGV